MSKPLLLPLVAALLTTPAFALDPSNDRDRDQIEFVLANADGSYSMSGSDRDAKNAKALRKQYGDRYLWFRYDGKRYVTTDPALLTRVDAAMKGVREIGEQQAKVGAKQAALGAKQAKLGAKQAAIGTQLAAAAMSGDEKRQQELEREMETLSRAHSQYEPPHEALAEEQEALGGRMELAVAAMHREIDAVAEQAVRSGKAKALP